MGIFVDVLPLDAIMFGVAIRVLVRVRKSDASTTMPDPDERLAREHEQDHGQEQADGANTTDSNPNTEQQGTWDKDKNLAPPRCKLDTPPAGLCVPAINIEHAAARTGGFLGLIVSTQQRMHPLRGG